MTTAYTQRITQQPNLYAPDPGLRLAWSASAQGQEARKMRENVRAIGLGIMSRGHSVESLKLNAAVRDLAESIEALQAMLPSGVEASYNHIPTKQAFSVQATYKFIGKLKPRQFPLDE
jgi:hypothetical protein